MAWEWSHAPEAYENGRRNLAKKSLEDLMIILAEWRASNWDEDAVNTELDLDVYAGELAQLKAEDREARNFKIPASTRKENLADSIWEYAERLRTCTNGGHMAWVCPFGCHLVNW